MDRSGIRLGLVLAVLLVPAGAARAEAPSLRRLAPAPAGIGAVAYAGADRVYATGRALRRVLPDGRVVLVQRLRGTAIQLDASPTVVAVVEARGRARRLLAGPPSGPLQVLASCRGRFAEIPYAQLAVAGNVVAEALSCERARGAGPNGATAIRLHDSAGVRTIQAPAGAEFVVLAGAPGMLAWATRPRGEDAPMRVEVADPASGTVRYGVPGLPAPVIIEPLAVQDDGSAVFCGRGGRLAWASPAAPTAHSVGRAGCPIDVAVAGGQVAYRSERNGSLRLGGLDGRARTLVKRGGGLPFDWDGERLLVAELGCAQDFLADRAATGPAYRGPACDVRVVGVTRGRSRSTVRVTVACEPGCRGDVTVQLGHGGRTHSAPLRLRHAGRRAVRVRLGRRAARLLRDYRAVPVHAVASYVNPADGATSTPLVERSGTLPGDGTRPFPPPPPAPPD